MEEKQPPKIPQKIKLSLPPQSDFVTQFLRDYATPSPPISYKWDGREWVHRNAELAAIYDYYAWDSLPNTKKGEADMATTATLDDTPTTATPTPEGDVVTAEVPAEAKVEEAKPPVKKTCATCYWYDTTKLYCVEETAKCYRKNLWFDIETAKKEFEKPFIFSKIAPTALVRAIELSGLSPLLRATIDSSLDVRVPSTVKTLKGLDRYLEKHAPAKVSKRTVKPGCLNQVTWRGFYVTAPRHRRQGGDRQVQMQEVPVDTLPTATVPAPGRGVAVGLRREVLVNVRIDYDRVVTERVKKFFNGRVPVTIPEEVIMEHFDPNNMAAFREHVINAINLARDADIAPIQDTVPRARVTTGEARNVHYREMNVTDAIQLCADYHQRAQR